MNEYRKNLCQTVKMFAERDLSRVWTVEQCNVEDDLAFLYENIRFSTTCKNLKRFTDPHETWSD